MKDKNAIKTRQFLIKNIYIYVFISYIVYIICVHICVYILYTHIYEYIQAHSHLKK